MTHFGEIIEYVDDNPVNLMVPSNLTKTVSILNYRPPKFQSYEKIDKSNPRKKQTKFQHQTHLSTAKVSIIRKFYKPKPS